jgi:hypothetical protein
MSLNSSNGGAAPGVRPAPSSESPNHTIDCLAVNLFDYLLFVTISIAELRDNVTHEDETIRQNWAHESQTDAKKGFGGAFGVQSDRVDKSAVGFEYHEKLAAHASQKGMPFTRPPTLPSPPPYHQCVCHLVV